MRISQFHQIEQSCTLAMSLDEYQKISDFRANYAVVPQGNGRQVVKLLLDLILDGPPVDVPPVTPVTPAAALPR